MSKLQSNHPRQGFSLVELSIVILIISIILTISATRSSSVLNSFKQKDNLERMRLIQQALVTFVSLNGRLPCPASFTQADGVENCELAKYTGTNTGLYRNAGILLGAVPVQTLGLSLDYMNDSWHNYYSYRVIKEAVVESNGYFLEPTIIDPASKNRLQIKLTNGVLLSQQGVYAIISHGVNGFGAFSRLNAGRQNTFGISSNTEISNMLDATGGVTATVFVEDLLSKFDDVVIYQDELDILMTADLPVWRCPYGGNLTSITEDNNEFGSLLTVEESLFTAAFPNQISRACPTGYVMHNLQNLPAGQIQIYCGPYGQWQRTGTVCVSDGI